MENDIKRRIFNCLNPFSCTMSEFLKLTDVEYSDKIQTACVTCDTHSKLLLNKNFIDTYCKTDEHLFMLVMHEMYHIVLGHTKLFKIANKIDNIVFDAIINSLLIKTFNDESYSSFFTNLNSSNTFPSCLLRPKSKDTPKKYIPYLDSLYESDKTTYIELYELMCKELNDRNAIQYFLIGNHGEIEVNGLYDELYRKIVKSWPENMFIKGRDPIGQDIKRKFKEENLFIDRKQEFYKFLKKKGLIGNNNCVKDYGFTNTTINSFIPNMRDRTIYTKRKFYQPLIYMNTSKIYKIDDRQNKSFIYVDVSGSVFNFVNSMLSLLKEPVKKKLCELYVFSTKVYKMDINDFNKKAIKTTGGTEINCCFEHFFNEKRNAKRIIIITDGFTGKVYKKYIDRLKNIEVDVILFGDNTTKEELKNIVNEFWEIK